MTEPNKQINCKEYIALACCAINSPLNTVKTIFHDEELSEIYYSYKENKDLSLEIRLNAATLTCLFDENEICEGVFLFLDNLMDITYFIEYCNKTYPCDVVLKGWVVNNCLIQINTDNKRCYLKECSLLVLPIIQIQRS